MSITVIHRDARDLSSITNDSVQLTVTSPPYNISKDYLTYNDNIPHEQWEALLYDVFGECNRVMCEGARIAVNVPWGVGRNPYQMVFPFVAKILGELFELTGTVVWKKPGSSGKTSWGAWRQFNPCIRDCTESIIIAKKPGKLAIPDEAYVVENGKRVSPWLSAERFMQLTQDWWEISPVSSKSHPAMFNPELPKRVIELYGYPGCTVLDPFAGSGSTGVAAKQLGCNAILVDVDSVYCDIMRSKLTKQPDLFNPHLTTALQVKEVG